MRSVQVVEAKARFSALLAEVESGASVAITRHGKVVARLVPAPPRSAAEAFAPCWPDAGEIDLKPPADPPPQPVGSL
jgi:prevent-host-death family protein